VSADTHTTQAVEAAVSPDSAFGRILVGIDGTEAAYEACRQIAHLAEPEATIDAVAVVHVGAAVAAALEAARVPDTLQRRAEVALDRAVSILGRRTRARSVDGFVVPVLLDEIDRIGAGLLALGSHGHRRATEIVIGGVAGELLHKAPCSVLIARRSATGAFPHRLVVGHDGSTHADYALEVAEHLARRGGAALHVVAAVRGKHVDLEHVRLRTPSCEEVDRHPVAALVHAAADADLLVLGSRGLHGLRALGSVSERVAHQAPCSVLVIRQREAAGRERPC
jgi:nucleotide-binding universal stress UspA family protein